MPFAVELFADALGVTTQELDKMLERGEVYFDENTVTKVTEKLQEFAKSGLPLAINTLAAASARARNALTSPEGAFQTIANAGFVDAVIRLLNQFTKEIGNSKDALETLGRVMGSLTESLNLLMQLGFKAFRAIGDSVDGLTESFGGLGVALGVLLGLKVGKGALSPLFALFGSGGRRNRNVETVAGVVGDLRRPAAAGSLAATLGGIFGGAGEGRRGLFGVASAMLSVINPFTKLTLAVLGVGTALNEVNNLMKDAGDPEKEAGIFSSGTYERSLLEKMFGVDGVDKILGARQEITSYYDDRIAEVNPNSKYSQRFAKEILIDRNLAQIRLDAAKQELANAETRSEILQAEREVQKRQMTLTETQAVLTKFESGGFVQDLLKERAQAMAPQIAAEGVLELQSQLNVLETRIRTGEVSFGDKTEAVLSNIATNRTALDQQEFGTATFNPESREVTLNLKINGQDFPITRTEFGGWEVDFVEAYNSAQ